ncbi:hypothetical protein IEQ34_014360 [Dendrobium chrysotoxum]|uniref:Ubiquitin-like protease family profile domain-containing protein n=1 Tax=Dendrobium chrysotoxum TaxID=161865 RepID=A0AAV7GLU1_DENCH|nr:hypothetical protein IEQ34_014360 [Dendrobium chrysotoxum]
MGVLRTDIWVPHGTNGYNLVSISWYYLVPMGTTRYRWVPLGIDMGDMIYFAENVQIFRSQIDKLLTDQNIDNNHVDGFAILLAEKNKLQSIQAANFLLMPVAEKSYWTLLVANLKSSAWLFFNSLPNPTNRAVHPKVINHLYEETQDCFEGDIQN